MAQKREPSILLNYVYNLIYQLVAIAFPLVVTPYISRTLQAESIGAYSYCYSIATYFSIFSILGLNLYGQLEISKCRNDDRLITTTFWGIFISKAITSIFFIFLYFLTIYFTKENVGLYFALSILLIANIIDISWFYQGIEKFKNIAIRNLIIKLGSLIMIFMFVKGKEDVITYALILNGATFIANISLWISFRSYIKRYIWNSGCLRIYILNAIPYFIPTLASSIYTVLDKSMLGWIGESYYENGVYEQTHKIVLTAATVVSSLSAVLLPRMSFLFSQDRKEEYKKYLYKVLRAVGVISFPMVLGMISVADNFIPVYLGEQYDKCVVLLKMFSPIVFFSGINTIIGGQCLIAKGQQKKYNIGVIIGATGNIILNLLLIPRLLSVGAVLASVFAELLIFIMFLYFLDDIRPIKIVKLWEKSIIASLLMFLIIIFTPKVCDCSGLMLIINIAEGVVFYSFALLLLKEELMVDFFHKFKKKVITLRDSIKKMF